MDVSSGRELALVKNVGVLDLYATSTVTWEYDLRITDLGFTRSFSGKTWDVTSMSWPHWPKIRRGGGKDVTISFDDVRRIRIKRWRGDWYVLTISMKRFWKKSRIGKLILRNSHYFQVTKALESIPELNGRLKD